MGNLHDLLGWVYLLIHDRLDAERPYTPLFSCELLARVQIVANHWREWIRYHPSVDCGPEASAVAASVLWLELNYNQLWS